MDVSHLRVDLGFPLERPDIRVILERANNLADLPDVADVVKGPLIHLLRNRDGAQPSMGSRSIRHALGQSAEILQVQLALFLEMVEGILGAAPGILAGL